jgi:hypothetical protein
MIPRAFLIAGGLLVAAASMAAAQEEERRDFPRPDTLPPLFAAEGLQADSDAAPLAFGPGERLEYKVKIGWFGAGEGELTLSGVDTIFGRRAYRAYMRVKGGLMGVGADNGYHSWIDVGTQQSWRFLRTIDEGRYTGFRFYEMFPARGSWERQDNDEFGPLGSMQPLDDIAFIYYLRGLSLIPGDTLTIDRYFKEDGNPILVEVVRYDERETEGVRYETVVVRPRVKNAGLFGEDGEAEIHLTRDALHYPVYMKFDIPNFPGSLTLHLRSVVEGLPLNPDAREEALARQALEAGAEGSAEPDSEGRSPAGR